MILPSTLLEETWLVRYKNVQFIFFLSYYNISGLYLEAMLLNFATFFQQNTMWGNTSAISAKKWGDEM